MTDLEITQRAEKFWHKAGFTEPFPRSLESAIAWALPVTVVKLPRLELSDLNQWLLQRRVFLPFTITIGCLRACLVARAGRGVIFLDGSDPDDEQRFSLAHEIAHFMLDYLLPRQRALVVLGKEGRPVLDGTRPPTSEERLEGILQGGEVGTFTHLMDRSETGDVRQIRILEAEDRADRLALELLAPRVAILSRLRDEGILWKEPSAFELVSETLKQAFGLPEFVAEYYGRMLVMVHRPAGSFREWLSG